MGMFSFLGPGIINGFGGGGSKDTSGQDAIANQQKQQDLIKQGQKKVDDTFAQFDPAYYNNLETTYENSPTEGNPAVDNQYDKAMQDLQYALANSGITKSSAADTSAANLAGQRTSARATVANNAVSYANNQKSKLANEQNQMDQTVATAADPLTEAGNLITGADTAAPTPNGVLSNLFTAALGSPATASAVATAIPQIGLAKGAGTGASLSNPGPGGYVSPS